MSRFGFVRLFILAWLVFFRDGRSLECDLLFEIGHGMGAVEIKSGEIIASGYFDSLNRAAKLVPEIFSKGVVYEGTAQYKSRSTTDIEPFHNLYEVLERFEANQK